MKQNVKFLNCFLVFVFFTLSSCSLPLDSVELINPISSDAEPTNSNVTFFIAFEKPINAPFSTQAVPFETDEMTINLTDSKGNLVKGEDQKDIGLTRINVTQTMKEKGGVEHTLRGVPVNVNLLMEIKAYANGNVLAAQTKEFKVRSKVLTQSQPDIVRVTLQEVNRETPLPPSTETPVPSTTETSAPPSTETPMPSTAETSAPPSTETPMPSTTETPVPPSTETPVPSTGIPNISGEWYGSYYSNDGNKGTIGFYMPISVDTEGSVVGGMGDDNYFTPCCQATITGNLKGNTVSFKKTEKFGYNPGETTDYTGTVSHDGKYIEGTWEKPPVSLFGETHQTKGVWQAYLGSISTDIGGDWKVTINSDGISSDFNMNLSVTSGGTVSGTTDNPSEEIEGSLGSTGFRFKFTITLYFSGSNGNTYTKFTGDVSPDGKRIRGTWVNEYKTIGTWIAEKK